MSRPGSLVHAEHGARDHAERHGWDEDYRPERDEPSQPPAIEDDLMRQIRARALAFEMARASVVAREEQKARAKREVYQRFIEAWNDCTPAYADPSPDWRTTVSHWLGRGMPIDRIVEAVQIAGRKNHLPATAIYPYMAKIVWNWLTDLEAEIEVEVARSASDEDDGGTPRSTLDLLQLHIDGESARIPAQYRYEKAVA